MQHDQEEVKESGTEINDNTEEETTETVKTGGKANIRQTTKKDGSDTQAGGKV